MTDTNKVPIYGEIQGREWSTPQPVEEKAVFQFEIQPDHFTWAYLNQELGAKVSLLMQGPPTEAEAHAFVRACQQLVERCKT